MNYPGFGGSSGPARLHRIGPAAIAACDEIKRQAPGARIVVFGDSLGTTAALHVGAERPVAGLILHNPPALRQIVLQQQGWWNLWLLAAPIAWRLPDVLDSVRNASRCHEPALFLLSENDSAVAPRFQQMVARACSGPRKIIPLPGADHNTPLDPRAMTELRAGLDWILAQSR